MPSPLLRLIPVLLLGAACVVPPQEPQTTPIGLEAPVMSPPGEYDARQRASWWESRLSRMAPEDRAEASLALGELYLELGEADNARMSFLEARGAELSVQEQARADRGIGLSYYLDGRPELGQRRLMAALPNLEEPAQRDIGWLLAASGATGSGGATPDMACAERMGPYLDSAGIRPIMESPNRFGGRNYYDHARSEWKAASMSANHDPMEDPYRITIHHSAMPLRSTSLAMSLAEVRTIQRLHQRDRGWADVGYHFLIDRAGRIHEGRPLGIQGAHATGDNNRGNIGICLLGNFVDQPEIGEQKQKLTAEQKDTLEALVDELCADFQISPKSIYSHKKFTGTECPGPELIGWVYQYNQRSATPRRASGAGVTGR